MRQPVDQLRGFFSAFFSVTQEVWSGFLAGWPGLPGNIHHDSWSARLKFCIDLFFKMPNSVRVAIIRYSIEYTIEHGPNTLLRSLLPAFGSEPESPSWTAPPASVGDVDAKEEARRMMATFKKSAKNPKGPLLSTADEAESEGLIPAPFNK